ncbi:MAG: PAS domain S-box protein [Actinobacteria bacterium]|nr:PAS domain S-box protein [Actinomycetota bacterium]MCA1738115.1 PAS domain S-box protein [Actinomycetota bacterium]
MRAQELGIGRLFETIRDAVIVAEARTGEIVLWNPVATEIFGYSPAEALGLRIDMLVPDRLKAQHRAGLARYCDTGHGPYIDSHALLDLPALRKTDEEIRIEMTLSPISPTHDAADKGCYVLAIIRDVTERKLAEKELTRRAEELARINAELKQLSYSISHDLRGPLRGIDGFSHILLEDHAPKLDEEGKAYLRRVREASQRMGELMDDLLNLTRLNRGSVRWETVDLSALAKAFVKELQQSQPQRRVEFVIEEGLRAEGDRRLLQVALNNLLDNAWKFTQKRPHAKIEFGAMDHDDELVYFVRDDGAGFEMAYAEKLFGPFQRLHATSEFEGTGIGLAAVQSIIHRHGGRVWAEGADEKGATFYFTLAQSNTDVQK